MISCGNWKEASLIRHQSWKWEGNGEDEKKMQKHRRRKELFRGDLFFSGKRVQKRRVFGVSHTFEDDNFLKTIFLKNIVSWLKKTTSIGEQFSKSSALENLINWVSPTITLDSYYEFFSLQPVHRTCGDAAAASSLSKRRRRQHSPLQGDGWEGGDLLRI